MQFSVELEYLYKFSTDVVAEFSTCWNFLLHFLLPHRVSHLHSPKWNVPRQSTRIWQVLMSINLWICFSFWILHIAITHFFTVWVWKDNDWSSHTPKYFMELLHTTMLSITCMDPFVHLVKVYPCVHIW